MSRLRRYALHVIAVALLAVLMIAAVDWLTVSLASTINNASDAWFGQQEKEPYWYTAMSSDSHVRVTSSTLTFRDNDGVANATYTVIAPGDSKFIEDLESHPGATSGNDLVDYVLGDVGVADFRYGFTGEQQSFVHFDFEQVSVNPPDGTGGSPVTVTITADPIQLYRASQQIEMEVTGHLTVSGKSDDLVRIDAASIGAFSLPKGWNSVPSAADDKGQTAAFYRGSTGTLQVTASGSKSGPGWLDGLRGIGGIDVPFADDTLGYVGNLFVYAVLLWALWARPGLSEELSRSQAVTVARRAALTVTAGLVAVVSLNFLTDLAPHIGWNLASLAPHLLPVRDPLLSDALSAVPVGLLVTGALVAWPAACSRVRSASQPRHLPAAGASAVKRLPGIAATAVLQLGIVGGYLALLHRVFHLSVDGRAVPAIAIAALGLGLARLLLGRRKLAVPLAAAGLLAGALATTLVWPLLWYTDDQSAEFPQVNAYGKDTFLVTAVAVALGLILVARGVIAELVAHRGWRWCATALTAAVIALVIIPDAATHAQVLSPNSEGLVPSDLFGLLDMMPALLDWLLLGLAIAVAAQLPAVGSGPDPRSLARRLAFPIGLTILCGYDTWLYLPLSLILGLFLLARMALPGILISGYSEPRGVNEARGRASAALKMALTGWRRAEIVDGQRQALTASGTEKLRELVTRPEDYGGALAAVEAVQEDLAARRDQRQSAARTAKTAALSHYGNLPDAYVAWQGAIAGAALGVIPAAVTLVIARPPSSYSGYGLLDFLGGTAWLLFPWPATGWFVGYYLPLLKGRNAAEKAFWLFLAVVIANLPLDILWGDQYAPVSFLTVDLELLAFLIVVCVYVCDLLPLQVAGMRASDWKRVHNWRFVLTWSAALMAIISTAVITFVNVASTDLANKTLNSSSRSQITGSSPSKP